MKKKQVPSSSKVNKPKVIKFPVDWSPYPFQLPLWRYLYNSGKKARAVWHRRAGKDIMGINWIIAAALREVGVYWYVYPTYKQGDHRMGRHDLRRSLLYVIYTGVRYS